jgi:hypothetical protein
MTLYRLVALRSAERTATKVMNEECVVGSVRVLSVACGKRRKTHKRSGSISNQRQNAGDTIAPVHGRQPATIIRASKL